MTADADTGSGEDHDRPTVLVAEDEPRAADLYANWLGDDYEVLLAHDGAEAIEAADEEIDVALLDRRMPAAAGDEVLEYILDQGYDCRVAMVTAVDPEFDIIGMGFDEYLRKPVEREELLSTVESLLERQQYDEAISELVSLRSKAAVLRDEKTPEELEASDDFDDLEARIEQLEAEADELVEGLDWEDASTIYRDIDANDEPASNREEGSDS